MKPFFFLLAVTQVFLFAHPTNPTIINGEVAFSHQDKTMNVTASDRSIVNWETFSIGSQEHMHIALPDNAASMLNRVTGGSMSEIMGRLSSNGSLYLINPKGILIGPQGIIECFNFIASTLNVSDQDFLQREDLYFQGSDSATIENLGTVKSNNGSVFLFADQIVNKGQIIALYGDANITASKSILFKPNKTERTYISFPIQDEKCFVDNQGLITAAKTHIESSGNVYEFAIKNTGKIQAVHLEKRQGEIFIQAEKGKVSITGDIIASSADSKAGKIEIYGNEIALKKANIDASGKCLGGIVCIGGEDKGLNDRITISKSVVVDKDTHIDIQSHDLGDAGKVFVWGDKHTVFHGTINGRTKHGNGGFVEISNKTNGLVYTGKVDLAAVKGLKGHLLFDPKNIIIQSTGTNSATGETFAYNPSETSTITGAAIASALGSANVTLQANTDITVSDNITSSSAGNLTLQAGRSIGISKGYVIDLSGGSGTFTAVINDENAQSANRDSGVAQFTMPIGAKVLTNANVDIHYGTFNSTSVGEVLLMGTNTSIAAGSGNVSIQGKSRDSDSGHVGIAVVDEASISGAGITLTGIGGNGAVNNYGVQINGTNTAISGSSSIAITGTAGNSTSSSNNIGVVVGGGAVITATGSATISLIGNGASGIGGVSGLGNLYGVWLSDSGTAISSVNGNITITGTGGSGSLNNQIGVFITGAEVSSTGTGAISITGHGGSGTSNCHGLCFDGSGTAITTQGANITLQGYGGTVTGGAAMGILVGDSVNISTISSNNISITGVGGMGGYNNYGLGMIGTDATISCASGTMTINATGGNSITGGNIGFYLTQNGIVQASGTGIINITSTGGATGPRSLGLSILAEQGSSDPAVLCEDGAVNVTATKGAATTGQDYQFNTANPIRATGTGTVTINGNIINY